MEEQYNRIKEVTLEKAGLLINDVNKKLSLYKIYETYQHNFKDVTSTEISMAKLLDQFMENYITNKECRENTADIVENYMESILIELRY